MVPSGVPRTKNPLIDQKLTACCILHVTLNTFSPYAFCLFPFRGCTVAQGSDLVGLGDSLDYQEKS